MSKTRPTWNLHTIRVRMAHRQVTTADLARACRRSTKTVRHWLTGYTTPAPEQMSAIASALGCTVRELGLRVKVVAVERKA